MKKLGELLVEREWVTRDQLTQALRHQAVFGGRLGSCLLELTLLSEERLARALSEQLGVPAVTQDDLRVIADGLLELVPAKLACRVKAIPFERFGNALSVAVADTRDLQAQDELSFVTSRRLRIHVAPEVRILEALEKHYSCPAEARFSRIWDRLNRAKYLWQEETAAPAGVRRRPESAPTPAPIRAFSGPEWQPAPPPPLESGVRRMAAAGAQASAQTAAPATPAAPAAAPAPAARPVAPTAPAALVPPDPVPEPAELPKRRWFFGRGKETPPTPVADAAPEPAGVAPEPQPPPPVERTQPIVSSPPAPRPPPVAPAAPRPTPATPPRPAPVAAPPPVPAPVSAPPASPAAASEVETLPPAPTPTPLVERTMGRAAVSPAAEIASGDTSPVLVPRSAATLADFAARMNEVEERDDVAHAALSFLSRRFQRNLLFMVRGSTVAAWMGGGEGVDQRSFGEVEVSFDEPSFFLNLREGSSFYRGPLPRLESHQRLVRVWGGKYPKECLLLPVRIKKRLVAAVYCDGGHGDLGRVDVRELQQMTALMARGFEAFLVKRKRS